MARVRVFAHKGKKDKHGTLPLFVRVTHGSTRRYVSLGMRVKAKDWSDRLDRMLPGREHEATVNKYVNDARSAAEAAVLAVQASGEAVTPDRLKEAVEAAVARDGEGPAVGRAGCSPTSWRSSRGTGERGGSGRRRSRRAYGGSSATSQSEKGRCR